MLFDNTDEYEVEIQATRKAIRRQSVVPAKGELTIESRKEVFYTQIMLPREERLDKYLSAIWLHLGSVAAPKKVDMLALDIEHQLDYLGESVGGVNNVTYIEIISTYEMPLDDAV